jgi:hypothetical protein
VKNIVVFISILCTTLVYSQEKTISGFVQNTEGEMLIGAVVYDKISNRGVTSNSFGFYSLKLTGTDSAKVYVSYVGYSAIEKELLLTKSIRLNFTLEKTKTIETVDIVAKKFKKENVDFLSIPSKQISAIPSLTGQVDIIKAYQLMPGVSSGAEGSNAIYVRGGSPDQNLFLLDDVPLYDVSHLGGFISVFDNNAIKEVTLMKGAFPAKYGGRLSSVVDVRMKDGNLKKYHGEIAISPLVSKAFIEGPILKDKTSFMFSARRSVIDAFTNLYTRMDLGKGNSAGYRFYDVNFKINHKIKDNDRLYLSFYKGDDKIYSNLDFTSIENEFSNVSSKLKINNQWGNDLASLRWNHVYGDKLFSNLTLAYTRYHFRTFMEAGMKDISLVEDTTINPLENPELLYYEDTTTASAGNEYKMWVYDYTAKVDYNWYINPRAEIKWGGAFIRHFHNPGTTSTYYHLDTISSNYYYKDTASISDEIYVYAESSFQLWKILNFDIGAHYSVYYTKNKTFSSLQPRFNLNINIKENIKVGASYNKMVQYIHLLPSTDLSRPTDFWMPANSTAPPESAEQFSINYHHLILKNQYEVSVAAYYKTMENLIEMKQHQTFFGSEGAWVDKIEKGGTGYSKGIELLAKKNNGKLKGWLAYTLSKTERKFENTAINSGDWFAFKYDKRHDISVFLNYDLNERISLSATWVFATGTTITLAGEKFPALGFFEQDLGTYSSDYLTEWQFNNAYVYDGRNNYRMPSYHRLDLSVRFIKQKKRGVRTWNIGIYNAYNRKNPYFLFFRKDGDDTNLYKFSLFPIIPSFGYSFKF